MTIDWRESELSAEDEQMVAGFMARLAAAAPDRSAHFSGADVLQIKAQLVRRWEAERRVQAPLDLMEPIQIGVGIAAAAMLLLWSLPSLLRLLPSVAL
jgi:hypothetical protein